MSRELVNEICAAQPGAQWSEPWGPGYDCWKVGDRTFAVTSNAEGYVSVKTDSSEMAELLFETGVALRNQELHPGWIALPLDAAPDELAFRLRRSYRTVRAELPDGMRAHLPPI